MYISKDCPDPNNLDQESWFNVAHEHYEYLCHQYGMDELNYYDRNFNRFIEPDQAGALAFIEQYEDILKEICLSLREEYELEY